MRALRRGLPGGNAAAYLLALATGVASLSCRSHETGPALSISVEGENLVPTQDVANAAAVCCCRVRGSVRNTSSIPVHVNIFFDARGASGSLGAALDWVRNIDPGATKPYEAVGIVAACADVTSLTAQHSITGIYTGSGGS